MLAQSPKVIDFQAALSARLTDNRVRRARRFQRFMYERAWTDIAVTGIAVSLLWIAILNYSVVAAYVR